jgi:hypothetical protein
VILFDISLKTNSSLINGKDLSLKIKKVRNPKILQIKIREIHFILLNLQKN